MPAAHISVLLVEDFIPFRTMTRSLLDEQPNLHVVGEVADGLEAVEKAGQLRPDLILLDIGLVRLHGFEVARRIRNLVPSSRIVFLSQEMDADLISEAFNIGACGYVIKQNAQSELLPAIDAALENKRFVGKSLGFTEDTAPHRHDILLCHDEAAIMDSFTHFIAAALNAGNPAIVLATKAHRDSLLQQLRVLGVRIDAAIEQGTYIALDADESTDAVEFLHTTRAMCETAAKAGKKYPRVAFCGERAGRLWAEGKQDQATQLEQFCDDLAKAENIDALCVYPVSQDRDDIPPLDSLFAEHSTASHR